MRSQFEIPCPAPPSSKLDDRATGPTGNTAPTLKRGGRGRGNGEGSTLTLISVYGQGRPSANKLCMQTALRELLFWPGHPVLHCMSLRVFPFSFSLCSDAARLYWTPWGNGRTEATGLFQASYRAYNSDCKKRTPCNHSIHISLMPLVPACMCID